LTPVLVVPVTVAANCFVVFAGTLALVGEMEIATAACAGAMAANTTKQTAISVRSKDTTFALQDLVFLRREKTMAMGR
jgi:hypothetical protein